VVQRRLVAGLIVAAIAAAAVWLLVSDDDSGGESPTLSVPASLSPQSSILANQLDAEQLVDQVLLLGFDGADPSAPIVAELGRRQLGGVLVQADNWTGAAPGAELNREIHESGRGRLAGGRGLPLVQRPPAGGHGAPGR
jgi:hypothetical protein